MIDGNTITAFKVKQNNQEFLVGVFSIKQFFTFTKFTERVIDHYDDENKPKYNDRVQRKLETGRVEKIAYFLIDDPDALFPTNIVLSIPNAAIESYNNINNRIVEVTLDSLVFQEMSKSNGDIYLTIIDGQHRIKGIEKAIEKLKIDIVELNRVYQSSKKDIYLKRLEKRVAQLEKLNNIELMVSFFIDPSLEFQAMVFSTINRTQKTVPASLVSSLFGLTENDSPYKTALEIVLALNAFETSPFYNRIKLHGGSYERNQSPPLTQAAMVKSIVDLISTNSLELERDRHRDRKDLLVNCTLERPFRKYYAKDQDNFITDILFAYFTAVKHTFVSGETNYWNFEDNTKPTNVLQTTVGYQALLNILVDILAKNHDQSLRDDISYYKDVLSRANTIDLSDTKRYPFTSKTKNILYLDINLKIWPASDPSDSRFEKIRQLLG